MDTQQFILNQLQEINKHVSILNDEMGGVLARIAVLENQVGELLWMQKLLLGAILLALVGAIFNLILARKNINNKPC
jgi:hypothetical protein